MVKEITTFTEFNEINKGTFVICFYKDDCPNYKIMGPIIDSLESDIPIYKFKLDIPFAAVIEYVYRIQISPTIIMIKCGIPCFMFSDIVSKSELESAIKKFK